MSGDVVVHLLPADDGDCYLIQTDADALEARAILIDGGRGRTYRNWRIHLDRLLSERRIIDLLVVTHIDADHIEGILEFLADSGNEVEVRDVWFNGFPQVAAALLSSSAVESFSFKQADKLSDLLTATQRPWNCLVGGGPICRELTVDKLSLPPFAITVLTPGRQKLADMAGPWETAISTIQTSKTAPVPEGLESLGTINVEVLAQAPDVRDFAKPNGSSIGLLIEVNGRKLVLAGDCHFDDLALGLAKVGATAHAPLVVDFFKVSHHGARKNTSKELLRLLQSRIYAFCTNGLTREHPDSVVIAKILKSSTSQKVLAFNYCAPAVAWDEDQLKKRYQYEVSSPAPAEPGYLRIQIDAVERTMDCEGA